MSSIFERKLGGGNFGTLGGSGAICPTYRPMVKYRVKTTERNNMMLFQETHEEEQALRKRLEEIEQEKKDKDFAIKKAFVTELMSVFRKYGLVADFGSGTISDMLNDNDCNLRKHICIDKDGDLTFSDTDEEIKEYKETKICEIPQFSSHDKMIALANRQAAIEAAARDEN